MNEFERKKPKYKEKEEQKANPLTRKWGYDDKRATSSLESTRREVIRLVHSNWDHLPEDQKAYYRDMLDYEKAYKEGKVTDWRLFWKQPQGLAKEAERLDNWWHEPLESPSVTPTGSINALDMVKDIFPDATIAQPLNRIYRRQGEDRTD